MAEVQEAQELGFDPMYKGIALGSHCRGCSREIMRRRAQSCIRREASARKKNPLLGCKVSWSVPHLPNLPGQNSRHFKCTKFDKDTIYDPDKVRKIDLVTRDAEVPVPLMGSPRMELHRPEPTIIREKTFIIETDYKNLGNIRGNRYLKERLNDKVLVPDVYTKFFDCANRRTQYVRSMREKSGRTGRTKTPECNKRKYNTQAPSTPRTPRSSPRLPPSRHSQRPNTTISLVSCQYCEVIGKKYCSFCREFENRHFAWGYEKTFAGSTISAKF